MSEWKIKAVAGALQPKALDLTKYARARSASRERVAPQLRGDDAAGALAFAAADDPLPGLLLRLKYAEQRSPDIFKQAQLILLGRYGGTAQRDTSAMMAACAAGALFEWTHDGNPLPQKGPRRGRAGQFAARKRSAARLTKWDRWMLVRRYLGYAGDILRFKDFTGHWVARYSKFVDVLHGIERGMASAIDLTLQPASNRAQATPQQKDAGE